MSVYDFNRDQYVFILDSNTSQHMGSFKTQDKMELGSIRVGLFLKGIQNFTGNESFKLKIYTESSLTNLLYESNTTLISDISNSDINFSGYNNWYGLVSCEFDRPNINPELTYHLAFEVMNYTRTNTEHIALFFDYPYPIYDNGQPYYYERSLAFQIYGYSENT